MTLILYCIDCGYEDALASEDHYPEFCPGCGNQDMFLTGDGEGDTQ